MEDTTNKLNLEQDLVEERVAIVGGGISGMLCKKWLKELNIDSDLYEEKESFFGIWDQKEGKTWDNMKTNLSQYCCQFSDHFWDICQPYLPTNVEVRKYLSDYVSKFGLNEGNNFFKTSVKKVVKEETTGYYVLELYDIIKEKLYIKKYKKVLIASGLHNSYEIPHFKGFENFTGDYIHSAQYKSPAGYEKKRVLIVGMSLSGGNISDAIGEVNESQVFLSCKVPAYIQK